jgi:hypothetical protein
MRKRYPYYRKEVRIIINKNEETDTIDDGYNKFNEQLDRLDATIDASEDLIESRTFEIAAGGLVLSLTILSLLRDTKHFPDWGMYPTAVIWAIFTIGILLNYGSQFVSKNSAIRVSKIIHTKMNRSEVYDEVQLNDMQEKEFKWVKLMNHITNWLLVLGTLLLISFTCYCFFLV